MRTRSLYPFKRFNRQVVLNISSIQGCGWLKQQNVNFLFGDRAVFDSVMNDQKLALIRLGD
jgi:hypothetical protein